MGFRYRCQQCHGYQLCQSCFWRGHANGPHSNQHQMKEHSSWVRQKPRSPSILCCVVASLNNSKVNISVSMWKDFTTLLCSYISCPLKTIQVKWNCIDWVCHVAASPQSFIIMLEIETREVMGAGSQIQFPSCLVCAQRRMRVHVALGLKWHAWKHETQNIAWNMKNIYEIYHDSLGKFVQDVFVLLWQIDVNCMSMKHLCGIVHYIPFTCHVPYMTENVAAHSVHCCHSLFVTKCIIGKTILFIHSTGKFKVLYIKIHTTV